VTSPDSYETAEGHPGTPNGFERLWTPHRMVYLAKETGHVGCPFCVSTEKSDEESLIVFRGTHAYVLLNLYPYNSGHLLVCPYRHVATYDRASTEEVTEIAELSQIAMRVLRDVSGCVGFNLGMNQGEVAGAGVEEHLHQHIVPRWRNDANFFPIVAQTKAIPRLLGEVRSELAKAWPQSN
jgi:ATP adenylyltransferase